MNAKIFLVASLLVLFGCSKKDSQPPVSDEVLSWIKPIQFRNENISVTGLTQKTDEGFLASGMIYYSDKSLTHGFVISYGPTGDTIWCRKVDIENYPNAEILYALQRPTGEILCSGICSFGPFKRQQFIGWLDAEGNMTKSVLFPIADDQVVNESRVIPTENGNLYFAFNGSFSQIQKLTIDLLDKDGQLIRSKDYDGIQTTLDRLYLSGADKLFLVGSVTKDFPDYADFLALMIDGSGNEIYRRTFGTTGYDVGYSACSDNKEGYVMSGMATNLSRPSVYHINSSGIVSDRLAVDDSIHSMATIILNADNEEYNLIIQSSSNLYFKKLGSNFLEKQNYVLSNPNPLYNLSIVMPEKDGSVAFLYYTSGPVIVKTISLN